VLNVSVWSKPAVVSPSSDLEVGNAYSPLESVQQIDMNKLVFEEKTIMGSSCYRDDHDELLSALDSGSIKLEGEPFYFS
jgi:(R,R)-butanediol dehydrogenase/meso-butanediol dehydrogenase/diacetyl reductase